MFFKVLVFLLAISCCHAVTFEELKGKGTQEVTEAAFDYVLQHALCSEAQLFTRLTSEEDNLEKRLYYAFIAGAMQGISTTCELLEEAKNVEFGD